MSRCSVIFVTKDFLEVLLITFNQKCRFCFPITIVFCSTHRLGTFVMMKMKMKITMKKKRMMKMKVKIKTRRERKRT